jgi:hypothetical protein
VLQQQVGRAVSFRNRLKIKLMRKYFLLFSIFCSLGLVSTSVFGQSIIKLQGLKGFKGEVGAWGIKTPAMVAPAKGYSLFDFDDIFVVIVPIADATAEVVANTFKKYPKLQIAAMGDTYVDFVKKGMKKKKPKPVMMFVCNSEPGCPYQLACGALILDGKFIRCDGACCVGEPVIFGGPYEGTTAETIRF